MFSRLKWLTYLSLDAPLVAIAWQALFSHVKDSHQTWPKFVIVFASVWLGYAADRWFDNLKRDKPSSPQHSLYANHQKTFLGIWATVLLATVALSIKSLSSQELTNGLILTAASLAYTLFAQKARRLSIYPLAKSLFTALLILCAALLFIGPYSIPFLALLSVWLLFASNCLFIRSWTRLEEPYTRTVAYFLTFGCAVASLIATSAETVLIEITVLISLTCLAGLHFKRSHFKIESSRALADVCLMCPFLVILIQCLTSTR